MKKLNYILSSIILFSCLSNKSLQKKENLDLQIINEQIKNNNHLKVVLKNETSKDYYLLMDTLSFSNKQSPFKASSLLYSGFVNIFDDSGNEILMEYVDDGCYNKDYYKEALKGPKKLSTKNVLKLKANKSVTFNVPFNLKTIIGEDCWYGYQTQLMKPEQKYGITFQYIEPNDYIKTVLPKSAQDSLQRMGYELYDKKIVSNKVPLILN
jgi:hypothetical protein